MLRQTGAMKVRWVDSVICYLFIRHQFGLFSSSNNRFGKSSPPTQRIWCRSEEKHAARELLRECGCYQFRTDEMFPMRANFASKATDPSRDGLRLEIASMLLDAGADPHVTNAKNQTVITMAEQAGAAPLVRLLKEH